MPRFLASLTSHQAKSLVVSHHLASVLLPAVLAAALGLFLLYGAGLAQSDVLHNAAHDARHAFAFPCH